MLLPGIVGALVSTYSLQGRRWGWCSSAAISILGPKIFTYRKSSLIINTLTEHKSTLEKGFPGWRPMLGDQYIETTFTRIMNRNLHRKWCCTATFYLGRGTVCEESRAFCMSIYRRKPYSIDYRLDNLYFDNFNVCLSAKSVGRN